MNAGKESVSDAEKIDKEYVPHDIRAGIPILIEIFLLIPPAPYHIEGALRRSFASQLLLNTAIFSSSSAPDSRMGRGIKEFQNTSVRFSRISAFERAKIPLGGPVSDEERYWKSAGFFDPNSFIEEPISK